MPAPPFTENGWPSIGADRLARNPVPGTNIVIPLQAGIPNTIMKAFAADFHAFCESLMNARGGTDEGGWTPTNSVWNSNHLGGTAMDLNWEDHTFRVSYAGFSPVEIAMCRELLKFYNYKGIQLIFWGQDWDSPKDAMHFQMGYNTFNNQVICNEFISKFIRPDGFSTFRRGGAQPSIPRKRVVPDAGGTFWVDVSQWQESIAAGYPHRVFSFRTNSGDVRDTKALENARRAKEMLEDGDLDIVIPYYFFRPGQANCDLHRQILEEAGLFKHPRTVTMVDVEGDNGSVTGDNSWEINDEVNRLGGWYGDNRRVIGYYNSNADPGLWKARQGINLVVPQYYRTPGDISSIRDEQVKVDAIAHQFTDKATDQKPWAPANVDVNWSPYNVDELLMLFGMKEAPVALTTDQMVKELWDRFIGVPFFGGKWPSRAVFRDSDNGVDDGVGMLLNTDGNSWDDKVVNNAKAGSLQDIARIGRLAGGEGPEGDNPDHVKLAKDIYAGISKAKRDAAEKLSPKPWE